MVCTFCFNLILFEFLKIINLGAQFERSIGSIFVKGPYPIVIGGVAISVSEPGTLKPIVDLTNFSFRKKMPAYTL
jgi:hypothetical protein